MHPKPSVPMALSLPVFSCASANRKFLAAKQPDMAEVQSCVTTADDESATQRTLATPMVPGAGGGVENRTEAQVKRRGGRRASILGWRI